MHSSAHFQFFPFFPFSIFSLEKEGQKQEKEERGKEEEDERASERSDNIYKGSINSTRTSGGCEQVSMCVRAWVKGRTGAY